MQTQSTDIEQQTISPIFEEMMSAFEPWHKGDSSDSLVLKTTEEIIRMMEPTLSEIDRMFVSQWLHDAGFNLAFHADRWYWKLKVNDYD